MTNPSVGVSPITPAPFDQDSCDVAPEIHQSVVCEKCQTAQCTECTDTDCGCLHVVALLGRAIVELDGSIDRTNRVLSQVAHREDEYADGRLHANAG